MLGICSYMRRSITKGNCNFSMIWWDDWNRKKKNVDILADNLETSSTNVTSWDSVQAILNCVLLGAVYVPFKIFYCLQDGINFNKHCTSEVNWTCILVLTDADPEFQIINWKIETFPKNWLFRQYKIDSTCATGSACTKNQKIKIMHWK